MKLTSLLKIAAASLCFAMPAKAQEDFIYSQFSSLMEDHASISLVWNLTNGSSADARNLEAALIAKISDGTPNFTARESVDLRTILGVDYSVSTTPGHLILTMMAPQETFFEAVDHFAESLKGDDISEGWLNRVKVNFAQRPSTRITTQANVEAELKNFALYETGGPQINDLAATVLRRPDQIITNGREFNFRRSPEQLVAAFSTEVPFDMDPPPAPRSIPSGVIFMEDDDANEALVFVADGQSFADHNDMALANTVYRYMGYGAGSEMFTILRQEKRASYDPQSHFTEVAKQYAVMGLSANVEASKWYESYQTMAEIYSKARGGGNSQQGLEDSKNQMINVMIYDLRRTPNYLVERYLEDYPYAPPNGRVSLPGIGAAFDLDTAQINGRAAEVMAPIDQMLTIVIGGHTPPPEEMRANGYCELERGQPLRVCLEKLSE